MIVVDSSVFIAMAKQEPEAPTLLAALASAEARSLSAGTYLECAVVALGKLGGIEDLERWLDERSITVTPVDHALARVAAQAFARFGKGRHPARLNYGDCFAYALAKSLDAPLLFNGDDFSRTDIRSALG